MTTPDTSPGDELDEVLQKVVREFNRSLSDYRDGVRPKPMRQYMAEAKDRLNRLMLTERRKDMKTTYDNIRTMYPDEALKHLAEAIKAIDAQLNKEENHGDSK